MARRCHLCWEPLPPVLGPRTLRSQHGLVTAAASSPKPPSPVAPSDAAHKGGASLGGLGEKAAS